MKLNKFLNIKILSRIIPRGRCIRGQVVVFYALMIPIFLFAGGVGLDLGWYYLNVSRLQNAADASVIAGARTLAADATNFQYYTYKSLVDQFPKNNPETTKDITIGNQAAANYALKNLSSDASYGQEVDGGIYTMKDNYTKGDNTIRMTPSLYKDAKDNYYYVVRMEENIHHFFLGFLDDMNAGVVSVAKLSYSFTQPRPPGVISEGGVPEGDSLLAEMYNIEDVSAIRNWEWQNYYKDKNDAYQQAIGRTEEDTKVNIYGGKWNEYQAKDSKKGQDKIRYKKGDKYRTETADVWAGSGSEGSKTGQVTNNKEKEVDSLNLDFMSDIQFKKTWGEKNWNDFDIVPDSSDKFDYVNTADSTAKVGLRIHSTFNFGTPYKKRDSSYYDAQKNPEDVLYVRIESEPIWNLTFRAPNNQNKQYASVRQIIININESNMDSQYRPLMFFYAGAEKINNASKVRDSQPIILNLNADARVIFFCPNTPIVINGNGHILRGFVVAKEFRRLTTADDYSSYTQEGKTRYKDKITNEEYFLKEDANGNKLFTDEYGNVQTKLLTENDVRDPDYIGKLTGGSSEYRNQYLQQISTDKLYLWNLVSGTPDSEYARCLEMPLRGDLVRDWDYEKVYKLEAFNLNTDSYYDSFQLASLKRKVYVYLDGYRYDPKLHANSDGSAHDSIDYYTYDAYNKSVDMFFTTTRAGWID